MAPQEPSEGLEQFRVRNSQGYQFPHSLGISDGYLPGHEPAPVVPGQVEAVGAQLVRDCYYVSAQVAAEYPPTPTGLLLFA